MRAERRMLVSAIVVALTLCVGGCQNKPFWEPDWKEGEVAWGDAVDGLRVGLANRVYEPGRGPAVGVVAFGLRLKNESGREMRILWPLKPRFGEPVLPLKGDESVAVVLEYETEGGVKTAKFTPPNRPIVYRIPPGEERAMEIRVGPEKFGIPKIAGGRVRGVYENRQGAIDYGTAGEAPVGGVWTGRVVSGSVQVE
jgi:hypothetical protein